MYKVLQTQGWEKYGKYSSVLGVSVCIDVDGGFTTQK